MWLFLLFTNPADGGGSGRSRIGFRNAALLAQVVVFAEAEEIELPFRLRKLEGRTRTTG